jgi:hypothetical protein
LLYFHPDLQPKVEAIVCETDGFIDGLIVGKFDGLNVGNVGNNVGGEEGPT